MLSIDFYLLRDWLRVDIYKILVAFTLATQFSIASASPPDKILGSELSRIFGSQRENLIRPNALLSEAAAEMMTAVEATPDLKGLFNISGCRIKSCTEKAIAIFDSRRTRLLGLGLLHHRCHYVLHSTAEDASELAESAFRTNCDETATLTVFIIHKNSSAILNADEKLALKAIDAWGAAKGIDRKEIRIWLDPQG